MAGNGLIRSPYPATSHERYSHHQNPYAWRPTDLEAIRRAWQIGRNGPAVAVPFNGTPWRSWEAKLPRFSRSPAPRPASMPIALIDCRPGSLHFFPGLTLYCRHRRTRVWDEGLLSRKGAAPFPIPEQTADKKVWM